MSLNLDLEYPSKKKDDSDGTQNSQMCVLLYQVIPKCSKCLMHCSMAQPSLVIILSQQIEIMKILINTTSTKAPDACQQALLNHLTRMFGDGRAVCCIFRLLTLQEIMSNCRQQYKQVSSLLIISFHLLRKQNELIWFQFWAASIPVLPKHGFICIEKGHIKISLM